MIPTRLDQERPEDEITDPSQLTAVVLSKWLKRPLRKDDQRTREISRRGGEATRLRCARQRPARTKTGRRDGA